jgi:hypothetical protein
MRQVSVQYAVANALGELDARKRVSDRFGELYGKSPGDYAKDQSRAQPRDSQPQEKRMLPEALGWDKYEPAFQRWAAYNSMQYVAKRDGAISAKEYAERQDYMRRWVADQQRHGKLPSEAEIRSHRVTIHELLLPHQKHITREEKEKTRKEGAYWRRVEDFSDHIKGTIDTERRYTRLLNDCAIAGAAAYGKSMDRVKADIEARFTQRYLYTPTEYYDFRLESGDRDARQPSAARGTERAGHQERQSRSGKARAADDDRGR